jgi:peptidoglycan/xylan/chitin deacetylase (PgdA/CDA1 family)
MQRREAARRRRRRRRLVSLLALLLFSGAALALQRVGLPGSTARHPLAAARPHAPRAATTPKPRRLGTGHLRSLTSGEDRALARFVRLGLPLSCGGTRARYVALTFDDGPGPYTTLALRILRGAHARATFFLVGRNLALLPRAPRAERRLAALGDHTWTHPFLPALPTAQSEVELARTQAAIAHASGAAVRLFRPPYRARNHTIDEQARALGMLEVLWSIDTRDSEGAPWNAIAATVDRQLHPGAIVLMHENHGQTIRALKFRILPMLRRRGYRTVTIPQLLALDPPDPRQLRGQCSDGGHVKRR